jgi:FkbM family methyltransferase
MHHGWSYPDADEQMWREQSIAGGYQASHLIEAMRYVTDKSLAVDGGAHVGTWSLTLSRVFRRVIAVEPAVDTFECLRANMARFDRTNVDTVNVALGLRSGFVTMALDGKPAKNKNTGGRHVERGGTIRCETIDDWNLPSLGFLKLDIEGSEPMALEGAALTLTRCKPVVLFEDKGFCTRYGYAKDAPQRILESFGYEHKARVGKDEIWTVRA